MKGLDIFRKELKGINESVSVKDLALVMPGDIAIDKKGNGFKVIDSGVLFFDDPESVEIFTNYDKNIKKKFGKFSDIGVIVIDKNGKPSVEDSDDYKVYESELNEKISEKDFENIRTGDIAISKKGEILKVLAAGPLFHESPNDGINYTDMTKYDKNVNNKIVDGELVIAVEDMRGRTSVVVYDADAGAIIYENEVFELNEKLITFGGKAYPKFGNAVLLAGGAGSGKGFVKDNLMGIEGQVYDVDEVKQLALKSDMIKKMAMEATGKDISKFNLKNPSDVSTLHTILDEELNVIDKRKLARYAGILMAPIDRKPNLIFDVTLKNLNKLRSISADIESLGYKKINTHLVWVINSYNVAIAQNKERSRQVPEEILMDTHRGAAQTAKDILDMGKDIKKYLDGDVWYAFNKRGVDSTIAKSGKGGSYIKDANYIKVKSAGKGIDAKKVTDDVVKKIAGYVPPSNYWG